MKSFDKLVEMVEEVKGDVGKARSGNKAAGTRVRAKMQEIKGVAQMVRFEAMELRDTKL